MAQKTIFHNSELPRNFFGDSGDLSEHPTSGKVNFRICSLFWHKFPGLLLFRGTISARGCFIYCSLSQDLSYQKLSSSTHCVHSLVPTGKSEYLTVKYTKRNLIPHIIVTIASFEKINQELLGLGLSEKCFLRKSKFCRGHNSVLRD